MKNDILSIYNAIWGKTGSLMVLVLIVLPITLFSTSCSKDEDGGPQSCDIIDVTYSGVIQPILEANCYECHGNGQSRKNVTLDTYEGVFTVANSGQLSGAVNHDPGYTAMPYMRAKLDSCSIKYIDKWIDEGALQN